MLVSTVFPSDDNDALKWAQHDVYGAVLEYWFKECRRHYLQAEKLLGVRTALGNKIETLKGFDHRSVQPAHDLMAAYFRRDIYDVQANLLSPREELREFMSRQSFVRGEVAALLEEPTFTLLLLEACTRRREPLGRGANVALADALRARYRLLPPDP